MNPPPSGLYWLPFDAEPFAGRAEEIAEIDLLLEAPGRALVCGPAGIGKSFLAMHWAASRSARHTVIWWIAADTAESVDEGLAELAIALYPNLSQAPPKQAVDWAMNWLASHGDWLLVLDGAGDLGVEDRFRTVRTTGRFLVTTRLTQRRLRRGALVLDVLTPDAAVDLVRQATERDAVDLPGVVELCAWLGHQPQRIRKAADFLAEHDVSPAAYLAILADQPQDTGPQTTGTPGKRTPPRLPRLRRSHVVLAVLAVLVSAVVLAFSIVVPHGGSPSACGKGLRQRPAGFASAGECTGVTAGGSVSHPVLFDPKNAGLTAVQKAITDENQQVTKNGSYVSIAFLGPLTGGPDSATQGRQIHELEGAHIAQKMANSGQLGGGVRIQLILANEGSDESDWSSVVTTLEGMIDGPEHLVGVVGLGLSQQQTLDAIKELAKKNIPMVSDIVTADGFDRTVPGTGTISLMSMPVTKQLGFISGLLAKRPGLKTAEIVAKTDTDGGKPGSDLYASSLEKAFLKAPFSQYYTATLNPHTFETNADLADIADGLCESRPDMVFFAARAKHLREFLPDLNKCAKTPMTVISGSDAVAEKFKEGHGDECIDGAKVSLFYVAIADPGTIGQGSNTTAKARLSELVRAFTDKGFLPSDLDDGWAIMAHDAMLAESLAVLRSTVDGKAPSMGDVGRTLVGFGPQTLQDPKRELVPGVAGDFSFDPAQGGNRRVYTNKPGGGYSTPSAKVTQLSPCG